MEIDIVMIVGLVGITLVISVGKWLDTFRSWLLGFSVLFNPLRILGEFLSCTISVGFFVGFVWSISGSDPWSKVFVTGGFISLISYVVDEVLALLNAVVHKLVGVGIPVPPMTVSNKLFKGDGEGVSVDNVGGDRSLSESEAHAMIGGKEDV